MNTAKIFIGMRPTSELVSQFDRFLPEATNITIEGNQLSSLLHKSVMRYTNISAYRGKPSSELKLYKLKLSVKEKTFSCLAIGLSDNSHGSRFIHVYFHKEKIADLRFFGKIWVLLISDSIPPLRLKRMQKELRLKNLPSRFSIFLNNRG